ncbi:MAG: DUF2807 domain-containing protein [Myxococcales bacterium]|nr:DUF2807 domain-containing protein [Myxococcales bacterium]
MRCFTPALALVASVALSACAVVGTGDYGVEERTVDDFDRIQVQHDVTVVLEVDPYQASRASVDLTITGDDNLLRYVETHVVDRTLHVQTDAVLWSDLELRVTGRVAYLDAGLTLDGSRLYASGIDGADFTIQSKDASRAMLSGNVHLLDILAQDVARVDTLDLRARDVWVDVRDAADVALCATQVVSGHVDAAADVSVHCHPDTIDLNRGVDIAY